MSPRSLKTPFSKSRMATSARSTVARPILRFRPHLGACPHFGHLTPGLKAWIILQRHFEVVPKDMRMREKKAL
jgi:hypothetical protein